MTQNAVQTDREVIEQAISRFVHMLNSHCPANLAPLMTADVELLADEEAKGTDAVNAFFVRLWEAYPCISFKVESTIIDENRAAVEVSYRSGPNNHGARCLVIKFRDGLLRRVRCY